MRPGQSFENDDVAENYRFRPDYPAAIFEKLIALSPGAANALDLGCGTGKIARGIHHAFESVTAIDASASMLRIAAVLHDKSANNIRWIHGLVESTDIPGGPFDLIVAAASIHWMDHAALFPRLLEKASANHVFAVVDGDGAHQPPWRQAWDEFLARWIFKLKGERYDPGRSDSDFERHMTRYRDWLDAAGEAFAEHDVSQRVDEFIQCQHSRDTFAPAKMGSQTAAFDAELRSILEPHVVNGRLTYTVRTRVEWGRIKPVR